MATYNRQSILASFGNLPVAPAGRTIHPVDADSPNVNAGELFIESNGVTIGLADIPTASDIKIGTIQQSNIALIVKRLILLQ